MTEIKPHKVEATSEVYNQTQLAKMAEMTPASVNRYIKRHKIKGQKSPYGRELLYSVDVLKALRRYHQEQMAKTSQPIIKTNNELQGQIKLLGHTNEVLSRELQTKEETIKDLRRDKEEMRKQMQDLQKLLKATQELVEKNSQAKDIAKKQLETIEKAMENQPRGFFSRLFGK